MGLVLDAFVPSHLCSCNGTSTEERQYKDKKTILLRYANTTYSHEYRLDCLSHIHNDTRQKDVFVKGQSLLTL